MIRRPCLAVTVCIDLIGRMSECIESLFPGASQNGRPQFPSAQVHFLIVA